MDREDLRVLNAVIQARRMMMRRLYELLEILIAFLALDIEENRPRSYCALNSEQGLVQEFYAGTLDMRAHVRVTWETFNTLEEMLAPERHGYDMAFRLLVFLFWLACGTSFRVVAAVFDIPRSTVHIIVHQLLNRIVMLSERVIRLPTRDNLPAVGEGFSRLARSAVFANAVGAIDGCHVKVKVCGPNKQDYFNRKLDYSVQFQALTDDKGMFINVYAGFPGSVHDSRVLRASPLYRNALYPPEGYFILGDGGYPLVHQPVYIVTTYRNPGRNEIDKLTFNLHHARGRNIVERAFGMLKARWRSVFLKVLEVSHTKAARIIMACCVMHNICISHGDILQPVPVDDDDEDDDDDDAVAENYGNADDNIAVLFRDHLARRLNAHNALQL